MNFFNVLFKDLERTSRRATFQKRLLPYDYFSGTFQIYYVIML